MRLASHHRHWHYRVGARHRRFRILGGVEVCLRRLRCRDVSGVGWLYYVLPFLCGNCFGALVCIRAS